MNKQLTETSFLRKPYSKPQMNVVELAGANIISTSGDASPIMLKAGQGYEEEDW